MNATPILPGLSAVEGKPLTATFDAGRLSSDGGMIVLREIAERLGLAETITGPLRDDRDPARVRHSYAEMAMARMVMIAAGYEDCDDVDALRVRSRLEDRRRPRARERRRPDEPADVVAGSRTCPTGVRSPASGSARSISTAAASRARLGASCSTSTTPTIPCTASRSSRSSTRTTTAPASSRSTSSTASRASRCCRCCGPASGPRARRWPRSCATSSAASASIGRSVEILVRGDSHYCSEPALALLEAMRCDYIIGFAINSKLLEIAAPWRDQCDMRRSKMKPTVRRFHQLPYRAREWSRSRKLVARVEATPMGTDVRFIVTNLEGRGKTLYEKVFCARGATPRT